MHKRFRIEIFDIDPDTSGGPGDRLCYVPDEDIVSGFEFERLNGEWTLDFTLDYRSDACSHIAEGKAVCLFDKPSGTETRERYVIREYKVRREGGKLLMDVHCEHRSRWMMAGSLCHQRQRYEDLDVSTAMNYILDDGYTLSGLSAYVADSALGAERLSLDLDYQTVLEALRSVADEKDAVFYMVDADEDNVVTLDYLSNYGTSYPTLFRYGKNEKAITKTVDWNEPATHVLPVGGGEPPMDITKHRLPITNLSAGVGPSGEDAIFIGNANWAIQSDDTYKTPLILSNYYVVVWNTQQAGGSTTEYYGPHQILGTVKAAGGSDAAIYVASGTIAGWSGTIDYCTIGLNSSKPSTHAYVGIDYVTDKDTADARGPVVERLYANDEMSPIFNLVQNATMDDPATWTSGLCPGWVDNGVGTVTTSKNTISTYVMHGDASMRVQTNAAGGGVYLPVYYTEGRSGRLTVDYVSLTIWIYLASGSGNVRVYVNRNAASGVGSSPFPPTTNKALVTTAGWNRVVIEAIDPQTAAPNKRVTVNVTQDAAGTADFYIDSLMVEPQASATEGFYGVSGTLTYSWAPTELMRLGTAELVAHMAGTASYTVSIADLEGALPNEYPDDGFKVGDTVGIYDEYLGINVQKRVMLRRRSLMNPLDCTIELENRPRTALDILAQHELDRMQSDRNVRKQVGRSLQQMNRDPLRQGFVVQHATTSDVITHRVQDWEETSRYPAT